MDFPVIQPKTAKEFYQETGRHNKIAVEGYNEEVNKIKELLKVEV